MTQAYRKKPLCEMCENLIKKVDEVLEKGGDVEEVRIRLNAAVDEFCREDVPSFLVEYCEKIISKNLKYIIEKLKCGCVTKNFEVSSLYGFHHEVVRAISTVNAH
ncbi:hypothetical protein ANCDUO_06511 [Ancylostoma duodenale]|uniref:Saposin B-type domain-containing protein n=1 Tax=Ancylostoma duodenale TaxID=51022 RepID=A0A0C2DKT2_9BILA|nr:hypothetical protein ANCDUO_06511 [Ancylostoma duodenale]